MSSVGASPLTNRQTGGCSGSPAGAPRDKQPRKRGVCQAAGSSRRPLTGHGMTGAQSGIFNRRLERSVPICSSFCSDSHVCKPGHPSGPRRRQTQLSGTETQPRPQAAWQTPHERHFSPLWPPPAPRLPAPRGKQRHRPPNPVSGRCALGAWGRRKDCRDAQGPSGLPLTGGR